MNGFIDLKTVLLIIGALFLTFSSVNFYFSNRSLCMARKILARFVVLHPDRKEEALGGISDKEKKRILALAEKIKGELK